jgi:RHS repeat-associated protein
VGARIPVLPSRPVPCSRARPVAAHDERGQPTKITDPDARGTTYTWNYGVRDRFISEVNALGQTTSFTYDAVGNRTSLAVVPAEGGAPVLNVAYTYDTRNRVSTITGKDRTTVISHNAAGRLTGQTVDNQPRTYAYDFRSQMTSLTDTNSVTFSYAVDGDGNRIREVGTAVPAVRYVYDGPDVVLEIESGVVKAAYVNGLGIDQPIERIEFVSGLPTNRHVYHTDALGSVWVMTDDLQIPAKSYTYEAFGKIRAESGTGLLFPNRYTYTAREALGDSLGLYYYRWRVMDPNVGRFTSEDPLGFVGDMSLYLYVGNQGVYFNDPFGLAPGDWWDARTWFNLGLTDSLGQQWRFIQGVYVDLVSGDDYGERYADSTLGQAEAAGPGIHKATKLCIGTATAATAAATTVIGLEAVGLIETTPQANNVIRIIMQTSETRNTFG